MYKIKKDVIDKILKENNIKKWGSKTLLAEKSGLSRGYVNQVLLGTRIIKKKTEALALTKSISSDLEIENLFDIM